ncbi:hypothetical protein B0H34DRAFT_669635 [Crassisporium funariophilum]|nr:hypothetical protein B0H34DRAFT_669635 [Crassisporium funariophilum]
MAFIMLALAASCIPGVLMSGLPTGSSQLERRQIDNGPLVGWTFVGCFTDIASSRTLLATSVVNGQMTPGFCTSFCQGDADGPPTGLNFAGTEFTEECFCDFSIQGTAVQVNDTECSFPCGGDATLTCGGAGRVSIFTNGGTPPANKALVDTWAFEGCHTDAIDGNGRTLLERFDIADGVTIESCTAQCTATGFNITGLEFGQECWCGAEFLFPNTTAPLGDCSTACKADHTELCGASSRLSVYIDNTATGTGTSDA